MELPEFYAEFVRRNLPAGEAAELVSLFGGGSRREFFRVLGAGAPAVLMANPHPPADAAGGVDENDTWVYVAGLLRRAGAAAPEVYAYNRDRGLILVEDVGDLHLQGEVLRQGVDSAWTRAVYHHLIRLLARIQVDCGRDFDPGRSFNPAYDADFMYRAEGLYFAEFFLGRLCGLKSSGLEKDLRRLAGLAGDSIGAEVFLYRDFQSRNLLLQAGEEPVIRLLDFQGGRLGPPAYDLASLVFDPYLSLPAKLRQELVLAYPGVLAERSADAAAGFERQFPLVAAHRLMQVLGAYAKLSLVDGKTGSLAYVPRALADLKALLHQDAFDGLDNLRATVASLNPQKLTEHLNRNLTPPGP